MKLPPAVALALAGLLYLGSGGGPLANRPQDAIALGWTRGRLANKYRQQLGDPAKAEEALELSWRVEVSPWLAIQPDVQRIRHPGGSAAASAVTIVGARFDIVF